MFKRRRFRQTEPLTERLAVFARLMRERAEMMSSQHDKAAALAKADQADRAAEINRWIGSPELKRPEQQGYLRRPAFSCNALSTTEMTRSNVFASSSSDMSMSPLLSAVISWSLNATVDDRFSDFAICSIA